MRAMDKLCPYCAETIKAQAIKCRYCHSNLVAEPPGKEENKKPAVATITSRPEDYFLRYEVLKKSAGVAFFLWFIAGMVGGHRYYLNRLKSGLAMTLLMLLSSLMSAMAGAESRIPMISGLVGIAGLTIWWIVDAFQIPGWAREYNSRLIEEGKLPSMPTPLQGRTAPDERAKPGVVNHTGPVSISICPKCRRQGEGDDESCMRCGHVFA
jgi:hypothetical protein